MESLYVEYTMSYPDAVRYLFNQRHDIYNANPIVGPMNVNFDDWQGSDMYYKGAWMLHTLRHTLNDDAQFFGLLKSFYQKNKISNVTTKQFINYVNDYTKKDFTPFFHQYLYSPNVPILEYQIKKKGRKDFVVLYRWKADVANFDMSISLGTPNQTEFVRPTSQWQSLRFKKAKPKDFDVSTQLFLVEKQEVRSEN
jgi:aminopeptidase N